MTTAVETPVAAPDLLAHALSYASHGWPVFPLHTPLEDGSCDCGNADCTSIGKHPRTAHGLKDASADELGLRRWWRQWPTANIGLPIQRWFVAVDIDGEDGYAALKAAGRELPPTAVAETGRGHHYIYRTQILIPPKVGLLEHVDLRGPGSYIVAPPSLHASGKRYRWMVPLGEAQMAPEWLQNVQHSELSESETRQRFDMAGALAGVDAGQRDVTLFRLASKLRYADVPLEVAERLVLEAAENCTPPFPQASALDKVRSAYGRYQASVVAAPQDGLEQERAEVIGPESVRVLLISGQGPVEFVFRDMEKTARDLDAELSVRLLLPGTPTVPYVQKLNVLSLSAREGCRRELDAIYTKAPGWAALLARAASLAQSALLGVDRSRLACDIQAPSQVEFIVDGLVPEDGVTVLFGSGSSAKTMTAYSMALAISRGEPWLGRATQKRNVLVIDYETGEDVFGYRIGRLATAHGMTQQDVRGIRHWWANGVPLLDMVDALKRTIAEHNIGFLVLDHCALACGGEPEKSDSAMRFYRGASRLKLPMLALAHITGDGEREPAHVLRPFGSIFWSNGARRTWFVQRQQEQESDKVELGFYCRKVNDGRKPADFGVNVFFDGAAGPITYTASDLRQSPALQETRGNEWIVYDALTEPMTCIDLHEALGQSAEAIRKTLSRHPGLFERASEGGGPGVKTTWQRARR